MECAQVLKVVQTLKMVCQCSTVMAFAVIFMSFAHFLQTLFSDECETGRGTSSSDCEPDSSENDADITFDLTPLISLTATHTNLMEVMLNLDRGKVTSRNAFRVLAPFAQAMNVDVPSLHISKSSINRKRILYRAEEAKSIRGAFHPEGPLIVDWDGIKLPSLQGKGIMERLPILVTGKNFVQLLGARVISQGTGVAQCNEIQMQLTQWQCANYIRGGCSDTTASNTGPYKGPVVQLEKTLARTILYLACRHYALEVIPKTIFEKTIEESKSPDIGALCKSFQDCWKTIDPELFLPAILTEEKLKVISEFARKILEKEQIRGDYEYLLELTLIFIGETPPRGVHFRPPIALSSARFMGRILYCLSIYMFAQSGQFTLNSELLTKVRDFDLFIVTSYLEPWFAATTPEIAPRVDLKLLQDLINYSEISPSISRIALQAFRNHLWYLSPHCIALSFFDQGVSQEQKLKMLQTLKSCVQKKSAPPKRFMTPQSMDVVKELVNVGLEHFVDSRTSEFFTLLGIDEGFLDDHPLEWKNNIGFQRALETVRRLQVVNDVAERGVALVK